jgi:hypothetical protein
MSLLKGRTVEKTIYKIGDIDIELNPIPFGRVLKIQEEFKKIQNEEESKQLEFIKRVLLEFTNLESDDIGDSDYSLTVTEVEGLFQELMKVNKNPKALGQGQK